MYKILAIFFIFAFTQTIYAYTYAENEAPQITIPGYTPPPNTANNGNNNTASPSTQETAPPATPMLPPNTLAPGAAGNTAQPPMPQQQQQGPMVPPQMEQQPANPQNNMPTQPAPNNMPPSDTAAPSAPMPSQPQNAYPSQQQPMQQPMQQQPGQQPGMSQPQTTPSTPSAAPARPTSSMPLSNAQPGTAANVELTSLTQCTPGNINKNDSQMQIFGWTDQKCHVRMVAKSPNGTNADCYFTKPTIDRLSSAYAEFNAKKTTATQHALILAIQGYMSECMMLTKKPMPA